MSVESPLYRKYDHRIRNLIANSKDPFLFPKLKIPLSTARSWIKKGPVEVVTSSSLDISNDWLVEKIARLENKLESIEVESNLLSKSIKILGFEIQYKRIPNEIVKESILNQIKEASKIIPIKKCLEIIGLSSMRYYSWVKRQIACSLEDSKSCPKLTPSRISHIELRKIKSYVTNSDLFHISIVSLSWLAKRKGEVFASPATWSKIVREYGLKRKRLRIYPAKPKKGVRALSPGQIWHIDMSIIRLQDGAKCYIQCVIDNFSRYVLAWKVSKDYGGIRSLELLQSALHRSEELGMRVIPRVWCDSGTENLNSHVNSLVESGKIQRTVAQIDIEQSNSMIESLFNRLKNRYLYHKELSTFDALVKHVDFYLNESNNLIPFYAHSGATPLEAYSGKVTDQFISTICSNTSKAKISRMQFNRSMNCGSCPA
jgi:putative transposase